MKMSIMLIIALLTSTSFFQKTISMATPSWKFSQKFMISEKEMDTLIAEQIEELNRALQEKNTAPIRMLPQASKDRFLGFIKKFRKEYQTPNAYNELEKALLTPPTKPIPGLYTTTQASKITTNGYPDLITHIINLNAIELNGPQYSLEKNFNAGVEDYPQIIEIYGYLPDDLETIAIPKKVTTLRNPLMARRQTGNECGMMSLYNAQQLYNLLNGTINKATFESNLKKEYPQAWNSDVQSCPIDLADIVTIITKRMPNIRKSNYTIIPTIVNDAQQLNYIPLQKKQIIVGADGTISASFDQDASLLQAIKNIHDENSTKYTHIFFLNNLIQEGGRGASMRHWIPVVLHKDNDQIYLYTINSQSVYYEDLIDPTDKVVDIQKLKNVVEKDNQWIAALIQLLSIDPKVLQLGLDIANTIHVDDYNYDYRKSILEKIKKDNPSEVRSMQEFLKL